MFDLPATYRCFRYTQASQILLDYYVYATDYLGLSRIGFVEFWESSLDMRAGRNSMNCVGFCNVYTVVQALSIHQKDLGNCASQCMMEVKKSYKIVMAGS